MVDFQSRDTRRGVDDDSEDEDVGGSDDVSDTVEGQQTDDQTPDDESAEPFDPETLSFAIVTVGGDRNIEDDTTGNAITDAIDHAGDEVTTRELIGASYDKIQSTVNALVKRNDVEAVITVGGTGIEPDDVTVDAVDALFDKQLPGFGELYRVLSHDFEGTAVIRRRTTAGIIDGVPVFCLPGDTKSARRGVEQIVLEEAGTLAKLAHEDTEAN